MLFRSARTYGKSNSSKSLDYETIFKYLCYFEQEAKEVDGAIPLATVASNMHYIRGMLWHANATLVRQERCLSMRTQMHRPTT